MDYHRMETDLPSLIKEDQHTEHLSQRRQGLSYQFLVHLWWAWLLRCYEVSARLPTTREVLTCDKKAFSSPNEKIPEKLFFTRIVSRLRLMMSGCSQSSKRYRTLCSTSCEMGTLRRRRNFRAGLLVFVTLLITRTWLLMF